MGCDADPEPGDPLRTAFLSELHRPFQTGDIPGDYCLSWAIRVRHYDGADRARLLADRTQDIVIESEHRGHTTGLIGPRRLHDPPTLSDEPERGGEIHHPSEHERAELTERVAGGHRGH